MLKNTNVETQQCVNNIISYFFQNENFRVKISENIKLIRKSFWLTDVNMISNFKDSQ